MSEQLKPDTQGPTSPPWRMETRLVAAVLMIIGLLVLTFWLRQLIIPLLLAIMLAYVLHPIVQRLRDLRIPQWVAVMIVYLVLVLLLSAATTGIGLALTQQITGLVRDLGMLSTRLPAILDTITNSTYTIGPWTIDLTQINLEPLTNAVTSGIQPVLSRLGSMLGSILGGAASTVGLSLLVLVMGYYILRDFDSLGDSFILLAPEPYRQDFRRLLDQTSLVWQAFLRGQLLLGLVVGVVTAVLYATVGLRFALGLGLIAGLFEFVPVFGPLLAGTVAVLVALFQGSNAWGFSPLGFALLIVGIAVVIQQIENNILVPRIIGQSLNLHPLAVLLAALAGGVLAGIPGVLLAAPVVATGRLWIGYVYRKTVGIGGWPAPVAQRSRPLRIADVRERLRRLTSFRRDAAESREVHQPEGEPESG